MKHAHPRRTMLAAILAVALASCHQQPQSPAEGQGSAEAAPETKPGLELTGGVLMLPIVEGHPGAAYFKLTNGGTAAVTLASVHIDGATSAEIHETRAGTMKKLDSLELGPGDAVNFERGGLHVMAFGLSKELGTGKNQTPQTEMTLTFSDGDKLSAPLAIQKMGTAMDMPTDGDSH